VARQQAVLTQVQVVTEQQVLQAAQTRQPIRLQALTRAAKKNLSGNLTRPKPRGLQLAGLFFIVAAHPNAHLISICYNKDQL
jgi:hypothetical protein